MRSEEDNYEREGMTRFGAPTADGHGGDEGINHMAQLTTLRFKQRDHSRSRLNPSWGSITGLKFYHGGSPSFDMVDHSSIVSFSLRQTVYYDNDNSRTLCCPIPDPPLQYNHHRTHIAIFETGNSDGGLRSIS
ncbi:uncharacterized protein ARMOST_07933 [Armillaria ostoyae]|uniref:Uncharacterized protein n=1 Tax=Armillaria ostoyae TaxID=47428 RepID=A0A284R777_ARMOS|nr:uncharacterized protein ARMOST_07933 [Armillaria ostoyae]